MHPLAIPVQLFSSFLFGLVGPTCEAAAASSQFLQLRVVYAASQFAHELRSLIVVLKLLSAVRSHAR